MPFQLSIRQLPILLILLLSLALSATALDWGLPPDKKGWAFDELTPQRVSGGARREFANGWVANYPAMHYRLLHYLAEGVRLAAGDEWAALAPSARDVRLRHAGRWLSVLMATLLIWGIYRGARLYAGRFEACLAAAIAATCLPFTYYAKTANVDVPYLFWFVASLLFLGRTIRKQRWRDHIALAVTAAAAVATKDQAVALYVPLPFILFGLSFRRTDSALPRGRRLGRALADPLFLVAAGAAVATFASLVNLVDNWDGFTGHLHRLFAVSVKRFDVYPPTVAGHTAMGVQSVKHLAFAMSWPLLILSLLGVGAALRRRKRPLPLTFLMCAVSYYAFFISISRHNYVRFMLPITIVLAFFAASALVDLCRPLKTRPWAMAAGVVLLLFAFARPLALDRLMLGDSRYAAEEWLGANTAGTRVCGVGRPQMLPRGLINMPWKRLQRLGVPVLAKRKFDYIVLGRSGIWRPDEAALAERLTAPGSGYVLERCFNTRAPWPMPSTAGMYTNLDKLSPEVCVLRREMPTPLGVGAP